MEETKKLNKSTSIVIGGIFAAVASQIPILNLLSFTFYFLGGALAVYHYFNRYGDPGTMPSAYIGSFAGFIGGGLSFMVINTIQMASLSDAEVQELINQFMQLMQSVDPETVITEEYLRANMFSRMWIFRIIGLMYAVVTGAFGGLASRLYFRGKKKEA